jgi:hypothetical protein
LRQDLLRLLNLPEDVLEAYQKGLMAQKAIELAKVGDEAARQEREIAAR